MKPGKNQTEVYIDFNAQMTDEFYLLTSGSRADLEEIGLTVEQAVGKRFTFVMREGEPDDLVAEGVIERSEKFGFVARISPNSIRPRSQKAT